MIDIIIVKFNNSEYEDNTVKHVLSTVDHRKTPYHLTVYDNYENDYNLPKAWNKLIERSDADYICLLNSDTEPRDNWLEVLLATYEEYENVGCVGPGSNCAGGKQGKQRKASPYGTIDEKESISGMCLFFPKKLWEELGGFDENFEFYADDKDFGFRAVNKGYRNIIRYDVFVFHYGQKTTAKTEKEGLKNYKAINRKSQEYFINKHYR